MSVKNILFLIENNKSHTFNNKKG